MENIIYEGNIFKYYSSAKYAGTSIITNKKWLPGESIYWNSSIKSGFTEKEALEFDLISSSFILKNNLHKGSTDKNITYDDSYSRDLTKKLFYLHQ